MSLSKRVEKIVQRVYERNFAAEAFRQAKADLDRLQREASNKPSVLEVIQGGYNDLASARQVAAERSRPDKKT
jgi:hypothetical protein